MSEHEQDQPTPDSPPENNPQPEAAQPAPPQEAAQPGDPQPAAAQPNIAQPDATAQPGAVQPEWIPVPPPNPYAAAGARPAGRGLAIAAMAVGLAAILTTVVSAFYFSIFTILGAALGLVAIALGIVALAGRRLPKSASITGVVAGALAIFVAVGVGALALGALIAPDGAEAGSGSSEEWQGSEDEDQTLLEWPANLATGGILFGEGAVPVPSDPLQPGASPEPNAVDREDGAADVLVYVDYRCPHCMHFEQASGPVLDEALRAGTATVEVVPLTFLDRASEGAYYSSRASAAEMCVVDGQPAAAWSAHQALLSPAVQPEAGPGHTNEELVGILDEATGGLDAGVRDCIASERFVPFAQALNDWVFANPVPNALDPALEVTGTPLVLVNGVPYAGSPDDAEAFRAFFAEQTR